MDQKKMPLPGKKRFVNPLNKQVGRRTGRDFRAGKQIRVRSDGLENWDDYLSESDADSICLSDTRNLSEIKPASGKENGSGRAMFQSAPVLEKVRMMSNISEESMALSQASQVSMLKNSKFAWFTNKNIGRRTGKDIRANKQIRVMENGLENFDDYLSDPSDAESFLSKSSCRSNHKKRSSGLANESKHLHQTGGESVETEDPIDRLHDVDLSTNPTNKQGAANSLNESSIETEKNSSIASWNKSLGLSNRRSGRVSIENTTNGMNSSTKSGRNKSKHNVSESGITSLPHDGSVHDGVDEDIDLEMEAHESLGEEEEGREVSTNDQDPEVMSDRNLDGDDNDSEPDNAEDDNNVTGDSVMNEDEIEADNNESHRENHPTTNESESDPDDENNDTVEGEILDNEVSRNNEEEEVHLNITRTLKTYERKSASSQKRKSSNLDNSKIQENNKSPSEKRPEASEGGDETDGYTDQLETSDIGGSQYQSGLDVAGNRSGSITKLSEPGSAVSFDRTKKRLSYSALEASEKSKKLISKRVEAANIELARQEYDATKQTSNQAGRKSSAKKQTSQKPQNQMVDSEKDSYMPNNEEDGNEFLCLMSRSSHVTLLGRLRTGSDDESDTDISIVDDTKPKHRSFLSNKKVLGNGRKKAGEAKQVKSGKKGLAQGHTDVVVKPGQNSSKDNSTVKKGVSKINRKLVKVMDEGEIADSRDELDNVELSVEGELLDASEMLNELISEAEQSEKKGKLHGTENISSKRTQDGGSTKQVKRKLGLPGDGSPAKTKQIGKTSSIHNTSTDIDFKETHTKYNTNISSKGRSASEESVDEFDVSVRRTRKGGVKKRTQTKSKDKMLKRQKSSSEEGNNEEEAQDDSQIIKDQHRRKQSDGRSSQKQNLALNESDKGVVESDNISVRKEKKTRNMKIVKEQSNVKNEKTCKSTSEESNAELEEHEKSSKKLKQTNNQKNTKTQSNKNFAKAKSSSEESDTEFLSDNVSSSEKNKNGNKNQSQTKSGNNGPKKRKSSSEESDGRDGAVSKKKKVTRQTSKKSTSKRSPSNLSVTDDSPLNCFPVTASVHTPQPDATQVSTNLQSGVSFRVGRRSELLENVTSGPLTLESVQADMKTSKSLTPCITKKGQPRRSKGRRVTICPEENTHHILSADEATFEDRPPKINLFRHSLGMSDTGSPLPSPSSTPVHIFEYTTSETPNFSASKLPKGYSELPVEDRLIYPEPAPEGLRRSKRVRIKGLAWYNNEHLVWEISPDTGERVVKGVRPSMLTVYEQKEELKRKKRRLQLALKKASFEKEKKKSNRKLSIHAALPEDFCPHTKDDITIVNPDTQEEDGIECVALRDDYKPIGPTGGSPKSADAFRITKLFDQPCMSVGTIELMPRAEKPDSCVAEEALVFRILKGKMVVKIHNTSTLLETDDTFFVPYGNVYSLTNMRNDKAQLFYTVIKFNDRDHTDVLQEESK